jgi:cobalt-zinc-cadmium efflux system outer membrane protein
LLAPHSTRAEGGVLTLEEVLARADRRAPEGAVARAAVGVAEAEVRTAEMFPNPSISVSGARSEPSFAGTLSFRLPVFGQKRALERSAQMGLEQSRAEITLALLHLRHDARIAYYTEVRASEELAIAREIEGLTDKVAGMASERFSIGAGNRLEKEQAVLVHVRAAQEVSDRSALVRIAELELGRLIGAEDHLPPLSDPLAKVGPMPNIDPLLGQAHEKHPEIVLATREREAALARADLARAERIPVPTIEVGAELLLPATCSDNARTSGPGCFGPRGALSFDLPLLNQNGGPIARGEAEAAVADFKVQAALRRIDSSVRAAYQSLEAASRRAQFFNERYVPAADAVLDMAREGFSEGRTGLLPLLEAERAVLEARLGRTEALFTVQSARADLEEASGVLLSAP